MCVCVAPAAPPVELFSARRRCQTFNSDLSKSESFFGFVDIIDSGRLRKRLINLNDGLLQLRKEGIEYEYKSPQVDHEKENAVMSRL